ncbi:unnamed protein product [Mytilus coruscus]|uniref:Uncharacterized protein n=1 Tax=Mytilus coruscus TaxID=42192 RepID=A0A6J8AE59_MYTCO|nr:unnamed protein product [Mytilus coruscus]
MFNEQCPNNGAGYGKDGINKDQIVLVSQAANIVSKYTAFVGFDKDTNVLVCVLKKPPTFRTCYPQISSIQSRGYPMQQMACSMSRAPITKGFVIDGDGSCSATKYRKCAPASTSITPHREEFRDKKCAETEREASGNMMMFILSLQNFDGSWSQSSELESVLNMTQKDLEVKYKDREGNLIEKTHASYLCVAGVASPDLLFRPGDTYVLCMSTENISTYDDDTMAISTHPNEDHSKKGSGRAVAGGKRRCSKHLSERDILVTQKQYGIILTVGTRFLSNMKSQK